MPLKLGTLDTQWSDFEENIQNRNESLIQNL